jgi:hypothetical protein
MPRASYLLLEDEGFTFCRLFRKHFAAWRQVAQFVPIRVSGKQMVVWNYAPGRQGATGMRKLSVALAGTEAALPDTYGMTADALSGLMNTIRARHAQP